MLIVISISLYANNWWFKIDGFNWQCVGQELDQEDFAIFVIGGSVVGKKKVVTAQKLTALVRQYVQMYFARFIFISVIPFILNN